MVGELLAFNPSTKESRFSSSPIFLRIFSEVAG
jgi:hypothetical protein